MKLLSLLATLLLASNAHAFVKFSALKSKASSALSATATPLAVIVEATIEPDRMGEFMQIMETNAVNSRKEPGCLRFDVLRSQNSQNKFYFYELYKSPEAVDQHKKQAHYQAWADFKESGGTIESVTSKADAEFIP